MWSHYSDAYRGLCLEFDASIPGTLFSEAFKVTYQKGYPIVNVMDLDNREEFRKVILTKSLHWKYEKEWRIVYTEYEGGAGYRPFPPQSLTEVFFGALMPAADRNKILQWLEKYPNRVVVYEAKISRTKYELDIEELKQF